VVVKCELLFAASADADTRNGNAELAEVQVIRGDKVTCRYVKLYYLPCGLAYLRYGYDNVIFA